MKKNNLIINFSTSLPKDNSLLSSSIVYQIGPLIENKKNIELIDNQQRLNNIAMKVKDRYSDWIADINKEFLDKELTINNELSLFLISDLSNKRTEIFNTYNNICNILLINEIIKEREIDTIFIYNAKKDFLQSIRSYIKLNIYEIRRLRIKKQYSMELSILRHLRLLCKYLTYIIAMYPITKKCRLIKHKAESIFFSRYPLHFKQDNGKEEKYGDMVKDSDKYLINIHSDGLHQSINWLNAIKSRLRVNEKYKDKFIVIDDYISFNDLIKSLNEMVSLRISFSELSSIEYWFQEINISDSIKHELAHSYQRILGLLICYRGLKKSLRKIDSKSFYYYLHEYAYGRLITYTLHSSGNKNTIGMQHGPASSRKLLYLISSKETNNTNDIYLNSVPMPGKVLAEDDLSRMIYQHSGYNNVEVMNKVPRFHYLSNINISNNLNINLIASGLHDFILIYTSTIDIVINNPEEKFIYKPHPRSKINFNKFNLPKNASFSNQHISELFINTKLLYSSYSSVVQEAIYLNIPVKIIQCHGIINQSPIID